MLYSPQTLLNQAKSYCKQHGLKLEQSLGHGLQGIVFATDRESAIKIHAAPSAYIRERNVYLRLSEHKVFHTHGLTIPNLLSFDDHKLIIEMSLVAPPFLLDFGGAYLDTPAPHTLDLNVRQEWDKEKSEQFEADWAKVKSILAELEVNYQIYVADVNPGNIKFRK